MKRRLPILACGALVAITALSSCSTFDTDTVASVNGDKINKTVIDMLSADDAGGSSESNVAALNGVALRRAVSNMIEARVAEQIAEQFGIDLTAGRSESEQAISGGLSGKRLKLWNALSDDERNLVLDAQAAPAAMLATPGSAPVDLEQRYANPENTGFFCLRFMVFESADLAGAAYRDLSNGGDFATLANNFDANSNGGIVRGPDGGECVSLDNFRPPNTPDELARALFDGTPGTVIPPVHIKSSDGEGWFVLLHRPWSEIQPALTAAVEASPSFAEFQAQLSRARVSVANRFGVWDSLSASVAQHS